MAPNPEAKERAYLAFSNDANTFSNELPGK